MTDCKTKECCRESCDCCWKHRNLTALHAAILDQNSELTAELWKAEGREAATAEAIDSCAADMDEALSLVHFWRNRCRRSAWGTRAWQAAVAVLLGVVAVLLGVAAGLLLAT